jgi:hypothetical protein
LTPAKKNARSVAASRDAGPTVATIFVRFGGGCIGARRSATSPAVLRLVESTKPLVPRRNRFAARHGARPSAGKKTLGCAPWAGKLISNARRGVATRWR